MRTEPKLSRAQPLPSKSINRRNSQSSGRRVGLFSTQTVQSVLKPLVVSQCIVMLSVTTDDWLAYILVVCLTG